MIKDPFIKVSVHSPDCNAKILASEISTMEERIILMGKDFAVIPHQSIVDVVGCSHDGIVFMNGKVTLSTSSQLNLDIIKIDGKKERRDYLKVRTPLNIRLVRAFSMGKRARSYKINEPIVTRDVSLGGIAFYSNKTLLNKQKIELDFSVLKPGFLATAEILRRERGTFPGGYRYKYACRFLDVDGEKERVLCEFVFKIQIENHKKDKP